MAPVSNTRQWASPQDWAKHQALIADMYFTQRRTLQDVIEHMESQHDFYATKRMYKIRFRKWGLRKNTRRDESSSNTLVPKEFLSRDGTRGTKHAIPKRLESPDHLRLPEECLTLIKNYVHGSFDASSWARLPNGELAVTFYPWGWPHQVDLAVVCLQEGRPETGFPLLNLCFADYEEALTESSPLLLTNTYSALQMLSRAGMGLDEMFLKYATDMASTVYSSGHPFVQLLKNLSRAGLRTARAHGLLLANAYIESFRAHAHSDDIFLLMQANENFIQHYDQGSSEQARENFIQHSGSCATLTGEALDRYILHMLKLVKGWAQRVTATKSQLEGTNELTYGGRVGSNFKKSEEIIQQLMADPTVPLRSRLTAHGVLIAGRFVTLDFDTISNLTNDVKSEAFTHWGYHHLRCLKALLGMCWVASKVGQAHRALRLVQDYEDAFYEETRQQMAHLEITSSDDATTPEY